jgi:DNA-binding GntR family transcriptional regulator
MASAPGNPLQPIQQLPSLREQVRARLEDLIIQGVFEPGERLVEMELAQRLGVSRGPVREALALLELEGWVDLHSRQGAVVHTPSRQEIDDFFHVRRVIEVEAARLAAENASSEDIARLREILREGEATLTEGDDPFAQGWGPDLHRAIASVARNTVLSDMLGQLRKRAAWYLYPLDMERRAVAWQEHREIIEAISRNACDEAADLMSRHTDGARDAYRIATSRIRTS